MEQTYWTRCKDCGTHAWRHIKDKMDFGTTRCNCGGAVTGDTHSRPPSQWSEQPKA